MTISNSTFCIGLEELPMITPELSCRSLTVMFRKTILFQVIPDGIGQAISSVEGHKSEQAPLNASCCDPIHNAH